MRKRGILCMYVGETTGFVLTGPLPFGLRSLRRSELIKHVHLFIGASVQAIN